MATVNGEDSRDEAGSDFVFLFYTRRERVPGDRGTDPPFQERRRPCPKLCFPLSRSLPPFLSPTCCPHTSSSHPAPVGWAGRGSGGVGVGGGLSPCEAHVERRAGQGAAVAVSLFLAHWFLLGTNPGSPVSWAGRASLSVWGMPCQAEGDRPFAHPTGTCGVRGLSSVRLQLVAGLCPPCPLGLQGGSPAAGIWGP